MNINRELLIKLVSKSAETPVDRVGVAAALVHADWLIDEFVRQARDSGAQWADLARVLEPTDAAETRAAVQSGSIGGAAPSSGEVEVGGGAASHDGKYRPLWEYLRSTKTTSVSLTFDEIERILGFPLPPSSRVHMPHWYGYKGSAVARAIIDAGWKSQNVDLVSETVTFVRGPRRRVVAFRPR